MGSSSVSAVTSMSTSMQQALSKGNFWSIYNIASLIPGQIGQGIRDST